MKYRQALTVGWLLFTAVLALSGWAMHRVQAHGTNISYTVVMAVQMEARFDNGEPMDACQFTVYAPDDPATPWQTGECDANGRFTFNPDTAIPGNWAVSIRQAGHGEIVNVPIDDSGSVSVTSGGGGSLQTVLTGVATVWGFIGAALFFSNRHPDTHG